MARKKTYNAYIGFKKDIISDLVLNAKLKDRNFSCKLMSMANRYNIKSFKVNNRKLKELEKKLQSYEKSILKEYRKNKDKLGKLNSLLKFLEKKYKTFNPRISFQIPFVLSEKEYGILQGIQFPDNNPEKIKELIDLNPLEERLKDLGFNRDKDNIDIVLTCHSTKGIDRERAKAIIEKLQLYGEVFLYIGDKLYIVREDVTKSKEHYDISEVGRARELAIMRYVYETIEEATKELELVFKYVF